MHGRFMWNRQLAFGQQQQPCSGSQKSYPIANYYTFHMKLLLRGHKQHAGGGGVSQIFVTPCFRPCLGILDVWKKLLKIILHGSENQEVGQPESRAFMQPITTTACSIRQHYYNHWLLQMEVLALSLPTCIVLCSSFVLLTNNSAFKKGVQCYPIAEVYKM